MPDITPLRYSVLEIAAAVGIKDGTVRSHFNSYSDVFSADRDTGPRGKRVFSQETFRKYQLFQVLKSDDIRLTATDAVALLRAGHYDTLDAAYKTSIETLLTTVQRLRSAIPDASA